MPDVPEDPAALDADSDDDVNEVEWYSNLEEIDFGRMYSVFRQLALFDDMFLSMQGMNLAITDQHITHAEYALLEALREQDRTPSDMAMFVSAWTQMWIFALYELLRTWRQRIKVLTEHHKKGALEDYIARLGNDPMNPAASMRRGQAKRLLAEPLLAGVLLDDRAKMNGVFKKAERLRMNLAKHEQLHGGPQIPRAPGYGRINGLCGALDYMVHENGNNYIIINRRDLAEEIRRVELAVPEHGPRPPRKPGARHDQNPDKNDLGT
jgi:hypothetical protein